MLRPLDPCVLSHYIETKGFQAPRFRAEFFSVKSADEAVAMSVDSNANYHSVSIISLSLSLSVSLFSVPACVLASSFTSSSSMLTTLGLCHRVC